MPGTDDELPHLIAPASGTRYPLAGRERTAVGRYRDCDVVLRDPRCSRRQFEVVHEADGWILHPLATDNPPRVNGRIVRDLIRLADGSRIEVGNTTLVFRSLPGDLPPELGAERTLLASEGAASIDDAIRI